MMNFLQGIIPISFGLLIIYIYYYFHIYEVPKAIDLSLNIYRDSNVYFRAGDNSSENLKPIFVAIAKEKQYTVNEALPENNIIDGNIYRTVCLHAIYTIIKKLVN